MLYEKTKEIETQLVNIDYIGKPSNVSRLLEVTEKLEKKPDIRIVDLPACRIINRERRQRRQRNEGALLQAMEQT